MIVLFCNSIVDPAYRVEDRGLTQDYRDENILVYGTDYCLYKINNMH